MPLLNARTTEVESDFKIFLSMYWKQIQLIST